MNRIFDRPRGLAEDERILSEEACDLLAKRVYRFARGGGDTQVFIQSWWNGEMRWARNRANLGSDRRDIRIEVTRSVGTGRGNVSTNQTDDASLEAAVRGAERSAALIVGNRRRLPPEPPLPLPVFSQTAIWSDATARATAEARGETARALSAMAEAKGMLSAGYLELRMGARVARSSLREGAAPAMWDTPYHAWTQAQCSLTVRNTEGSGSGWAGVSGHDWASIDAPALAARALEKCEASQRPAALEPGRYTVILEPQAVADLIEIFAMSLNRDRAEGGLGPWALAPDEALKIWRTKLGVKVIDERITIGHEPDDPQLGIVPGPWTRPIKWIDRGVLTNLTYERQYAVRNVNVNEPVRGMTGYRMSGGSTTIDEMIQSTTRGLLVTRFSNVRQLDGASLLATGLTRDGLWLIEHGKISRAVKNFRFTESPLFVLNSIDQLGVPVPVFRPVKNPYEAIYPLTPAVVPSLKARDFSFTSTIDAI